MIQSRVMLHGLIPNVCGGRRLRETRPVRWSSLPPRQKMPPLGAMACCTCHGTRRQRAAMRSNCAYICEQRPRCLLSENISDNQLDMIAEVMAKKTFFLAALGAALVAAKGTCVDRTSYCFETLVSQQG